MSKVISLSVLFQSFSTLYTLLVLVLFIHSSPTASSSCPCRRPQGHHQESLHVEPWVLLIGTSWPLVGPQKGLPVGPPHGRPRGPSTP